VGKIDEPVPLDRYFGVEMGHVPRYRDVFTRWLFQARLSGTSRVAESILLHGSRGLKQQLVDACYPVSNELFTLFVLNNKHYKEWSHPTTVLERKLRERADSRYHG
jgi:hypothetical protein